MDKTPEFAELTPAELAEVVGGVDAVNRAHTFVASRVGTCGCGVGH